LNTDAHPGTAPDRIVLVDGYAQIYRCFYAIRGLTSPAGQPTNALYGMARFMLSIQQSLPHRFGALVLDKGKPRHRLELLPEYKGTRPPMPDALRCQLAPIRVWAEALGWPLLEAEGFEADDLIAAVVAACPGQEVAIVSHDKDLGQLVRPGVSLVQPGPKGTLAHLGQAEISAKFGVLPAQMRDYLALVGDSVDNIPGVVGVGAKTAAALLARFGSIEGILEHLAEVERPAIRDALAASTDLLQRNRALVTLRDDVPPDWHGLDGLRRRSPQWPTLLDLARESGFQSLSAELQRRLQDERNPSLF
jgi:5'-3' exonuclease